MNSLLLAIAFLIVSHPNTYIYTDSVFKRMHIRTTYDNAPGLPTVPGLLIHGAFMFIVSFIILNRTQSVPRTTIKIEKLSEET